MVSSFAARLEWAGVDGTMATYLIISATGWLYYYSALRGLASICQPRLLNVTRIRDRGAITAAVLHRRLQVGDLDGTRRQAEVPVIWTRHRGDEIAAALRVTFDFRPPPSELAPGESP